MAYKSYPFESDFPRTRLVPNYFKRDFSWHSFFYFAVCEIDKTCPQESHQAAAAPLEEVTLLVVAEVVVRVVGACQVVLLEQQVSTMFSFLFISDLTSGINCRVISMTTVSF